MPCDLHSSTTKRGSKERSRRDPVGWLGCQLTVGEHNVSVGQQQGCRSSVNPFALPPLAELPGPPLIHSRLD